MRIAYCLVGIVGSSNFGIMAGKLPDFDSPVVVCLEFRTGRLDLVKTLLSF